MALSGRNKEGGKLPDGVCALKEKLDGGCFERTLGKGGVALELPGRSEIFTKSNTSWGLLKLCRSY